MTHGMSMPACRSPAFLPYFAKALREGKHAGMIIIIPLGLLC